MQEGGTGQETSPRAAICHESGYGKNLDASWNGDETVLVQGIIDAYFIEGEEIVLVDYKTDRIGQGEES